MATSTANKGYVVPTVGADRNQWGTQWNQNLNQLDKNIGGSVNPVDVSGIGDFNVSAANAQIMAHVLTGALTGTRNYVFPAGVHGFWFISNNTSGNFSLFVKSAGGGLNLEILQGNAVTIWSDGVSIVPAAGSSTVRQYGRFATTTNQLVNLGQFAQTLGSFIGLPGATVSGVGFNLMCGNGTTDAGGLATITFPNSGFGTECSFFNVTATGNAASTATVAFLRGTPSKTSADIATILSGGMGGPAAAKTYQWFAIGY